MHKRRRDEDEPEEGTEKRLVNLIVRIGDMVDLHSHLQSLVAVLTDQLGTFRMTITDTILDCARGLQPKTPVYGALCGLLTAAEPRFGEDIVADVQRELQEALDDHATFSIRGFCRFAVELANARVLTTDSALSLLETLLAVREEPDVLPARAEWFCCIVLDCLALGGATFSAQAPERLAALMKSLREFDAARRAATVSRIPASLLAYGAATKAGEVTEHFDALLSLVEALASESHNWRSACLLAPSRPLAEQLSVVSPLPLASVHVPAHSQGCTYPALRRLRLGAAPVADGDVPMRSAEEEDGDASSPGGVAASGDGAGPGVADTLLLEEYTWMIVSQFQDSHKDAAKLLVGLQDNMAVDACAPFIETLLSMMLSLPSPRHRLVYYANLLLDVSRMITPAPQMLVRSINSLYSSLGRLDAELALRLAEWLALHISHFGYNLEPFEQMWAPYLSPAPIDGALHPAGRAGATAHDAFLSYLLDKAVRLAYLERVRKELPASFVSHLPPKPKGSAAWAPLGEGAATEPGSMAAKSAALLNRLRTKADQADVLGWLHRSIEPSDLPILVAHSLMDAGSKSVSHLERLLDKFHWLLEDVAKEPAAKVRLVGAIAAFWSSSTQMTWLVMHKMVRREFLEPQSIFSWLCSAEHSHRLAWHSTWEGVQLIFERALSQFKEVERELKTEEKRYAEYTERLADIDDGNPIDDDNPAARRLAVKKSSLERARREKKALFANFFASACSALDEYAKARAAAGEALETAWWFAATGHIVSIGRRYLSEFSLAAIEAVAEAEELSKTVNEAIFKPLQQLVAWQL